MRFRPAPREPTPAPRGPRKCTAGAAYLPFAVGPPGGGQALATCKQAPRMRLKLHRYNAVRRSPRCVGARKTGVHNETQQRFGSAKERESTVQRAQSAFPLIRRSAYRASARRSAVRSAQSVPLLFGAARAVELSRSSGNPTLAQTPSAASHQRRRTGQVMASPSLLPSKALLHPCSSLPCSAVYLWTVGRRRSSSLKLAAALRTARGLPALERTQSNDGLNPQDLCREEGPGLSPWVTGAENGAPGLARFLLV